MDAGLDGLSQPYPTGLFLHSYVYVKAGICNHGQISVCSGKASLHSEEIPQCIEVKGRMNILTKTTTPMR